MKIVSIKFFNLNSLKGEHEIRFDQPPFTESGLFAITGPTGAGKTTILDAITLAMYGEVHRHEKGDASEIMTRHTTESYSEVEFEVKGKLYRSKWSNYRAHKKASGKLQGVKMELSDVATNKIIENTKLANFHLKMLEITGLEYTQFLRSVILSQGDFTRFLKASENERSELLEKLTDTGIYSRISMSTFERTRDEKAKLEALLSKLKDVRLLAAEEVEAFEKDLADTSRLAVEKNEEKKKQENRLLWLQNIVKLEGRKRDLTNELEVFKQELEARLPLFSKLKSHQQALKHLPLLTETEALNKRILEAEKKLLEISLQLPRLEQQATDLQIDTSAAGNDYKNAEAAQKERAPLLTEIEKKDVLIATKQSQWDKEQKNHHNAEVELANLRAEVLKKEGVSNAMQLKTQELQRWLLEHAGEAELDKLIPVFSGYQERLEGIYTRKKAGSDEKTKYEQQHSLENSKLDKLLDISLKNKQQVICSQNELNEYKERWSKLLENKFLEEWEESAADLPALISICEQQLNIATQAEQLERNLADFADREKQFSEQLVGEKAALVTRKLEYKDAEEHLSALQKNVELQMLIQKYEADRKKLQPGQECPLCGSVHHPFVETHYTCEQSESEHKRDAQKVKLAALLQRINEQEVLIAGLEHDLKNVKKQTEDATASLKEMLQNFDRNNTKLPKALSREKTTVIKAVIEKKKGEFSFLKQKIQEIRNVEKKIKDNEAGITRLQEAVLKNNSEVEQAVIRIDYIKASLDRVADELSALSGDEKEMTFKIVQLLVPYKIEFDYLRGNEVLKQLRITSDKFVKTQQDLQEKQLQCQQLENEIRFGKESCEEKAIQTLRLKDQLEATAKELNQLKQERRAHFGSQSPAAERKRLELDIAEKRELFERIRNDLNAKLQALEIAKSQQQNYTQELGQLQQNYRELAGNLSSRLALDNISSTDELQQRFLPQSEAERTELLKRQTEARQAELHRLLMDAEADLQLETAKELTTETAEELAVQIHELDTHISELNQEIGRIKEVLKADEQRKEQYREIAKILELQQKEFERWNKLCTLIGSESGKKFSRFAQGLTLARLTGLANRHLLRLSDRYQILKSPEKDLELQIIDSYQADAVRPMATLSGGESFLVSLALALGLSDLASRRVRIDSLFIDEGFGTLDADTLDIAISALENLQANGKSIGIISHVEALKERIGTQIQVNKQPGGSSKIKVVSYNKELNL